MDRNRVNITKRILLLFLVFWITFVSVFNAYKTTTYCAEWVAGTMAAIAGAPITTALLIGGVVVVGGIALYELSQTSLSDHADFVRGIQSGFQGFVAEQETKIAKEQNSALTDQEAADIGVANARQTLSNFKENCLDLTRTTGRTLKTKTVEYWKRFCKDVSSIADNGIQDSGITENTVIKTSTIIYDGLLGISLYGNDNVGANLYNIGEKSYIYKGTGLYDYSNGSFLYQEYQVSISNSSDKYYIPYIEFQVNRDDSIYYYLNQVIIDKSNNNVSIGTIRSLYISSGMVSLFGGVAGCINEILSHVQFKSVAFNYTYQNQENIRDDIKARYSQMLSYNKIGESISVPAWKRTVNSVLEDTKFGSSIRTGRRQLANEGDYVHSTFKEDSIPVKKTGVRVIDNAITGTVGWDIPNDRVWDDVFSGGKPVGDVIGGTGVYQVPRDAVVDYPTPYDVTFPKDTVVDDVDNPPIDTPWDEPLDPDVPDPDRPIEDIIDENEGEFYPTALDWTTIFPFCIPFDIIYLVDKFNVRGEAPVITLPIVYPTAIRGVMGSDRYEVVIDFNDYVTIRNVIRVFLILLFIAGLMKVTRNLIRG